MSKSMNCIAKSPSVQELWSANPFRYHSERINAQEHLELHLETFSKSVLRLWLQQTHEQKGVCLMLR